MLPEGPGRDKPAVAKEPRQCDGVLPARPSADRGLRWRTSASRACGLPGAPGYVRPATLCGGAVGGGAGACPRCRSGTGLLLAGRRTVLPRVELGGRAAVVDPRHRTGPDIAKHDVSEAASPGRWPAGGTADAFEEALESDPYNPQLRDFYGHQLLRLRRYDDAIVQSSRCSAPSRSSVRR